MQTRGRTENGEVFLADVSFSTYGTPAGPRLSALIVDASEGLREREEANLEQLLAGSRILVAAVSHEVRNVCGAIGMMHENLARRRSLDGDEDFEALGSLVETLKKIASIELSDSVRTEPVAVDLNEVLTDLHIVRAFLRGVRYPAGVGCSGESASGAGYRHSLMQVLLNLARNSQRALGPMTEKWIAVSARANGGQVSIRFSDNGPGIPAGRRLFQPLQKGAEATGLGLYLSRAFMRSFRGELRHDAEHTGCSFVLDLLELTSESIFEATRRNMRRIRLLLLDDHILFREGLRRLLITEPDFEVVAECGTAPEALTAVRAKDIDVILLDFDLDEETGTRFISAAVAAGYRGRSLW